jgi:hypothetical protein
MNHLKGTVKNSVIVLDDGVQLPDGTEVEVFVRTNRSQREEAFDRIRRNPITYFVGIDEIIEEDKREREERADRWLQP